MNKTIKLHRSNDPDDYMAVRSQFPLGTVARVNAATPMADAPADLPLIDSQTCPCGFSYATLSTLLTHDRRRLAEMQAAMMPNTTGLETRIAQIQRHLNGGCGQ